MKFIGKNAVEIVEILLKYEKIDVNECDDISINQMYLLFFIKIILFEIYISN